MNSAAPSCAIREFLGMVKECSTAQLVQSRDASSPSWYGQGLMGVVEVTEQVQGGCECVGNAPPEPIP